MRTKLTAKNKDYIIANYNKMTMDELCNKLPKGIGQKTISKIIKEHEETVVNNTNDESSYIANAKKLMGIDSERGIVVMTEEASSLENDTQRKPNNDLDPSRIHFIKK